MRNIRYIAVHCTATAQNAKVSSIQRYWREQKGWTYPGYHYIIEADGNIIQLLEEELVSNGVAGWNSKLVNVCYIGGVDKDLKPSDNRTDAQKKALLRLLTKLKKKYPDAVIQGHRDFPGVKKACPSFDAKAEYSSII